MSEHTKGPWLYSKLKKLIRAAGGEVIAWLVDTKECEANGNLIAAAPEMLEALALAVETLESEIAADCHWCAGEGGWTHGPFNYPQMIPVKHRDDCPYLVIRAALRKAKGEA